MRRALLAVTAALMLPAAAHSQRGGLFGGFAFQGVPAASPLGVQLGATFGGGRPTTASVTLRFDVSYTRYTRPNVVFALDTPCPPGQVCGFEGPSNNRTGLTILTTTLDAVYTDPADAHRWGYWIAGLGVYGLAASPDGSYMTTGVNLGFGWRIGDDAFVEIRYHRMLRPAEFKGFLPITFGARF